MSTTDKPFDPVHAAANGYTEEDWNEVSDNPEWTEEDFRNARPFAEVFPELAASIERDAQAETRREEVTLRLDREVVQKFRDAGADWQRRIEDVLRNAAA